ncbi:MAG: hypothetical protein HFG20_09820 [Anaerotruncus sp.]|nr:hypothetical protein [Anaerotruncus sp.]
MWNILLETISLISSFQVTPAKITHALEARGESERHNAEYVAPEAVRIASVQLTVHPYKSLREFTDEMYDLAKQAVDAGAQLIVFPAYTGLLAGGVLPACNWMLNWVRDKHSESGRGELLNPVRTEALEETFHNVIYELYMYTFSTIARLLHVYVVGGSSYFLEEERFTHRCVMFDANGDPVGAQEKINVLGLDRELGVTPSELVEVVETPMGKVAMVLASDAYYFECFQIAKARGAKIIACPSGQEPVQYDLLRCRANEHGVYVAYACITAEGAPKQVRASILAPFEITSEGDGLIVACEQPTAAVVSARTSLAKLPTERLQSVPNRKFLQGDYLRSYRYCGKLPMIEQQEQPESEPAAE